MFVIDGILISEEIVEEHFACDLAKCKGACCWEGDIGAPTNEEEIEKIEEVLEQVLTYLPIDQRERIHNEGVAQNFEEDGMGITLMPDGPCAFLLKDTNTYAQCAFEKAFLDGKTDFYKPLSCHLYPIRISENKELNFEAINYDKWSICKDACSLGKKNKIVLYKFLKTPLIRKYGKEFYDQLETLASLNQSN